MKKIFVAIILIVGAIWLGISVLTQGNGEEAKAPGVDNAPYQIQTASRVYYAMDLAYAGGVVVIDDYYELAGDDWVFRDRMLVLDDKFGEVTVTRR